MKKEEKIKIEYEKAQDSAEHYNTMMWTLISVGLGLPLILLKFILFDLSEKNFYHLNYHSIQSLMIFVGIFIATYFSYLVEGANEKKNFKYAICKKIEEENDFIYKQNLETENLPISRRSYGINFYRGSALAIVLLFMAASFFLISDFFENVKQNPNVRIVNSLLVPFIFFAQILRTYPNSPVAFHVINPQANCSIAI